MILALSVADIGEWVIARMAEILRDGAASRGYIDLADLSPHYDAATIETHGPVAFALAAAPLAEEAALDRTDPAIAALEARARRWLDRQQPAQRETRRAWA